MAFALLLMILLCWCTASAGDELPNIVLIVADDLGYGDLGCYGHRRIRTPHIDRLAREGARCTNFYADAPVCSPTRASILTGRVVPRHGLTNVIETTDATTHLGAHEVLLPELLSRGGYVCGAVGKWHVGEQTPFRPLARGFDFFFGGLLGSLGFFDHDFVNGKHDLWLGNHAIARPGEYITDLEAEQAVAFVERHAQRPFFLYLPFHAVHTSLGRRDKGKIESPKKWLDAYAGIADDRAQSYAACVSALDEGVGRVLDALDRANVARETLVVFTSDNGPEPLWTGTAAPHSGTKHSLWEGGIRVPMLARWPNRIPAGTMVDVLAATHDLFPTILAAADVSPPSGALDGFDLLPALVDRGASKAFDDRTLYWSYIRDTLRVSRERAVRRGHWKWVNGELYDLAADPAEANDVADEYPQVAGELAAAWDTWLDAFPSERARWNGRTPMRHASDVRHSQPAAARVE